ncbi:MAG: Squalene/phytoene synthase [Gammaproteobacteria bacterium]|nr:Squalene/phytoene synthase [Gammaproteobacteria bacterium]
MEDQYQTTAVAADERFQNHILQGVSRTFALTIPVLPQSLARVVSNAYLLCRIADTIEDDKQLPDYRKREYSEQFIRVVAGADSAQDFATRLYPELSAEATADEKELIQNTPAVIRITHSFNARQRVALERCIRIMAEGMTRYQETNVRYGLRDQADMDKYCYFVAGVVGEMLTELFCDHCKGIDRKRPELMQLAVSFGQGLQMTNILKDIWEDQQRGMCWLPQDVFAQNGADLRQLQPRTENSGFQQALGQLVGVARAHLANALRYTLIIPAHETGIRRFCLWALGMAVLTLRKINANRAFSSGREVKISRRSVKATIALTNLLTSHDKLLLWLFNLMARPLPECQLPAVFSPVSETVPKL